MQKQKPTLDFYQQTIKSLKQHSSIVIVDLEATCTDDPGLKDSFINEIIEIGLIHWDRPLEQFNEYQIYVKPQKSVITPFCTQLTGIDNNTLKDAVSFKQAMLQVANILQSTAGIEVWGSYGAYDKNQIARQSKREGVKNPFEALTHFNVKDLAWAKSGNQKSFGLGSALAMNGLQFEGRPHSGVDDAYNIAVLLNKLMQG